MSVTPAGRLIGGEGNGELRVHHGENGTVEVGIETAFHTELVVGKDARVGCFRPGGRDGEDHIHGKRSLGCGALGKEVPYVSCIAGPECNGLGRVDYRAAAHGKNGVHVALAPQLLDALARERHIGVGARTSKLKVGYTRAVERCADAVEGAGADHRALAVNDEHATVARTSDGIAGAVARAATKDKAGGGVEVEIVHGVSFL